MYQNLFSAGLRTETRWGSLYDASDQGKGTPLPYPSPGRLRRIRDLLVMRYINLHFTYLLTSASRSRRLGANGASILGPLQKIPALPYGPNFLNDKLVAGLLAVLGLAL